jgi:hypothetical protein
MPHASMTGLGHLSELQQQADLEKLGGRYRKLVDDLTATSMGFAKSKSEMRLGWIMWSLIAIEKFLKEDPEVFSKHLDQPLWALHHFIREAMEGADPRLSKAWFSGRVNTSVQPRQASLDLLRAAAAYAVDVMIKMGFSRARAESDHSGSYPAAVK